MLPIQWSWLHRQTNWLPWEKRMVLVMTIVGLNAAHLATLNGIMTSQPRLIKLATMGPCGKTVSKKQRSNVGLCMCSPIPGPSWRWMWTHSRAVLWQWSCNGSNVACGLNPVSGASFKHVLDWLYVSGCWPEKKEAMVQMVSNSFVPVMCFDLHFSFMKICQLGALKWKRQPSVLLCCTSWSPLRESSAMIVLHLPRMLLLPSSTNLCFSGTV